MGKGKRAPCSATPCRAALGRAWPGLRRSPATGLGLTLAAALSTAFETTSRA